MCGCNTNYYCDPKNPKNVQRGMVYGKCGTPNVVTGWVSIGNSPQLIFVCATHCMKK